MDHAAEFVKSWTKLSKDWNAQMETELAPQLTAGQLEVLELLQTYEPMKPSDLLPYLETTPAAITTLLDRMERAGLVERNRDEGDRRIVWVTMTELGRAEVERGVAVRSAIVNRSLERISSHNRQLLVYLIGKVSGTRDSAAAAEPKKDKEETSSELEHVSGIESTVAG
ncbi:MarR family winged helix-turn-helix transcriptional regulator [Cohnella terricola]|uniref:MarR family transcriptional regulator n=1 Tax=Cohnella terricola TaxID=1289167 RepID=A0A559JR38_9BACL|nr:MarR family transcriptional regulator [Cohnella terricola]